MTAVQGREHLNPVYRGYFADPFVWKAGQVYYAIGTGGLEASGKTTGKIFPLLRSNDFIEWRFAGHAMLPPNPGLGTHFWAPEVAHSDGTFFLYYSVGHEDKNHQLRVATSQSPEGPFHETGKSLLDPRACAFAIDPHPFQDVDGQWYLFYARDFLDCVDGARAGTGLMVARMRSMTELEDEGRVVLRPRADWQRFQANRQMYGQTWDWHTLEGPFCVRHDNRYYCFYSGGRWETENYGVDYGISDHVLGPYTDAGNETGPRVLRTISDTLTGPGHNSVILGPDHETNYIVYHAWDAQRETRQMYIDELVWQPELTRHGTVIGPRVVSASQVSDLRAL